MGTSKSVHKCPQEAPQVLDSPLPTDYPKLAVSPLPTDYPKLAVLLQIFATLPVTTSYPERTFSVLRLLKTYLQSVMDEERLNGLTSMKIHRDISVTPDEVTDILALKPRKLGFVL